MTTLQWHLWASGRGRAPPVPGGFSNAAEWAAVGRQILPALLIQDFYYYWCHRFLHLPLPFRYIHKMHHNVARSATRHPPALRPPALPP